MRIRELRERAGVGEELAAERAGIQLAVLRRLEADQLAPGVREAIAVRVAANLAGGEVAAARQAALEEERRRSERERLREERRRRRGRRGRRGAAETAPLAATAYGEMAPAAFERAMRGDDVDGLRDEADGRDDEASEEPDEALVAAWEHVTRG